MKFEQGLPLYIARLSSFHIGLTSLHDAYGREFLFVATTYSLQKCVLRICELQFEGTYENKSPISWLLLLSIILQNMEFRSDFGFGTFFLYTLYSNVVSQGRRSGGWGKLKPPQ